MSEDASPGQRSYWCFISYRHADNREPGRQWATWLHQAIETYEVPQDLVGTVNERGDAIPARIFPVFRDEEELPADADLASPIYRALHASKFLVVICSPRAVASTYVDSEIKYFKQLGHGDRVLAAMVEGEPNTSWDEGKQAMGFKVEDECFPEAMRHHVASDGSLLEEQTEPIAADFRLGTGQGWTSPEAYRMALQREGLSHQASERQVEDYRKQSELMKLKIIAGILGVPLGMLTKRDKAYQLALAQKRARVLRLWLVAVGSLAVLAVAAGIVALSQKYEAVRQRIEADRQRVEADRQRLLALDAQKNAEAQKKEAIKEKDHAEQTSARSDFLQAEAMINQDRPPDAMPYLARSLRTEPHHNPAAALALNWLPVVPAIQAVFQHQDEVHSANFSRDGRWVVTASADKTARVWDAQTGQPLSPPLQHQAGVNSASFSPDGKWVVTASEDKTAQVWDAQTGKAISPPLKHADNVESASFSPDGKWVVTASDDATARVWDAQTGQPVSPPLKHDGWVLTASFSPDGKQVVTASNDNSGRVWNAQVWDAQTGQPVSPPLQHQAAINSARFSPDGTQVVTASDDKSAKVWDVQSGKCITTLQPGYFVNSASFSPDGKQVVTALNDNTARVWGAQVWDAQTGQPVTPWFRHADWVYAAGFSPDGTRVVTASFDKTARVWDAKTGQAISAQLLHLDVVYSAEFSPDGTRVVTASGDGTARVWNYMSSQSGTLICPPLEHKSQGFVTCANFSLDGKQVVTASTDKTAKIWDALSGTCLATLQHKDCVLSASFSPDGKWVVTASDDNVNHQGGEAQVWDAQTGNPVGSPLEHQDLVACASFSPDGKWVVTASYDKTAQKGHARVWDAQTGRPISPPLEQQGLVCSASFSPDGKWVVTASSDGTAQVWDAQTGKPVSPALEHHGPIICASFSPDGKRVLTASRDNTAKIWDALSGKCITTMRHKDYINSASFSPDGTQVVTASDDKTAQVWYARNGKPASPPLQHDSGVWSASFSPDGSRVVTDSRDNSTRVWDVQSGQPISGRLNHLQALHEPGLTPVISASFRPDGRGVVTPSGNNALIWEVAPITDCPDWLPDVLDASVFQVWNDSGSFQTPSVEKYYRTRQERLASTSNDPWEAFGRWFFSDPATRQFSPWSAITEADYVKWLIAEGTPSSLNAAQEVSYGHPDELAQIAAKRASLPPAVPAPNTSALMPPEINFPGGAGPSQTAATTAAQGDASTFDFGPDQTTPSSSDLPPAPPSSDQPSGPIAGASMPPTTENPPNPSQNQPPPAPVEAQPQPPPAPPPAESEPARAEPFNPGGILQNCIVNTTLGAIFQTDRFDHRYKGSVVEFEGTVARLNERENLVVFHGGGIYPLNWDVQLTSKHGGFVPNKTYRVQFRLTSVKTVPFSGYSFRGEVIHRAPQE